MTEKMSNLRREYQELLYSLTAVQTDCYDHFLRKQTTEGMACANECYRLAMLLKNKSDEITEQHRKDAD